MKVLMLGWEYPPHISGGLGTACEGLTRGLSHYNVEILFVVPQLFGGELASHMSIAESRSFKLQEAASPKNTGNENCSIPGLEKHQIPATLAPYFSPESYAQLVAALQAERARKALEEGSNIPSALLEMCAKTTDGSDCDGNVASQSGGQSHYKGDIFTEVNRYAEEVVKRFGNHSDFDLIHAHDWLTFPAGVALAKATGKPLIVHVHSLEFDRSGDGMNRRINEIEKLGVQSAKQVIAVSYYTRGLVHKLHHVPLDKISVVHNGVYSRELIKNYREERNWHSRVVLFLGRITFQKGPDYFVEAAAKVIPSVPDVLFVMAGAGDMLPQIHRRITELGIADHFFFPGFVKGAEVEQVFSLADVYVMPSVSEPFGISALEAISFNTPVIISRQSGVSEVLAHALKVDFWDVQRLADLIINSLLHEELREDMVAMAREEVKRVHWDAAAQKTLELYRDVIR